MGLQVNRMTAAHGDHLVDSIGELVTAILDMDSGQTVGQVAAVDVGDPGHLPLPCRPLGL